MSSKNLLGVFMRVLNDLIDSLEGHKFTVAGHIVRMHANSEEMQVHVLTVVSLPMLEGFRGTGARVAVTPLFVTEGDHGIYASGAAGGEVGGQEGDGCQEKGDCGEGQGVG